MRPQLLAALAISLGAVPVYAGELPMFDVDRICAAGATSDGMRQGCILQNQAEYDALRQSWAGLSDFIQDGAIKQCARQPRMDYVHFSGCVSAWVTRAEMHDTKQRLVDPNHFQP